MLAEAHLHRMKQNRTRQPEIAVAWPLSASPHLLQSPAWGALKAKNGWTVETIHLHTGTHRAYAQVLLRRVGPFSVAYIPRGPHLIDADAALLQQLSHELDAVARRHRVLWLMIEPNDPLPPLPGFVPSHDHIQPMRTVCVPLGPDDTMLAAMHKKTRYHIRLAARRGVTVRVAATDEIEVFYVLLQETSSRNGFGIHSLCYYRDVLSVLSENGLLLIAEYEDRPVATLIAAATGAEAIYLYGASSTEHRGHGDTCLLQFAAMQWARDRGCTVYDLWGIPDISPEQLQTDDGAHQRGSFGQDLTGLYRFKTGFGGEIVEMPATMEKTYHPLLARVVKSIITLRRTKQG